MRKIALEALRAELSEGERNAGANPVQAEHVSPGRLAVEDTPPSEISLTSVDDPMRGKPTQQVVKLDDDHFKPDFKGEGRKKKR
jgi:hypothetical protein